MLYEALKFTVGPLVKALYHPWIEGKENIPAEGAGILASNHMAVFDSVFLPLLCDRKITFIGKDDYFKTDTLKGKFVAGFMRGAGVIPVDRTSSSAAEGALQAGLACLREGNLFGIYPEGIDDEMVAQAPSLELVLPQFLSFADFSSSVLLAHNARFDTRFLLRGCQQVGIEWPFPACLDTVLFSRAVLPRPQVHNHRLGTLAHHFGIENPQAHRALADAYTCLHLFEELVKLTNLNQVEIPDSVLTVLTEEVAFAG